MLYKQMLISVYKLWFWLYLSKVTDLKPSPANDLQDDGNHNGNGKSNALACRSFDVNSPCYLISVNPDYPHLLESF